MRIENDGLINIMGREDSQVKINGYRVEINEIKNVMLEFSSIDFVEIDVERPRHHCIYKGNKAYTI